MKEKERVWEIGRVGLNNLTSKTEEREVRREYSRRRFPVDAKVYFIR